MDVLQTPETPNDKKLDGYPYSYYGGDSTKRNHRMYSNDDDETKHVSPSNGTNRNSHSDMNGIRGHHYSNDDKKYSQWKQQKSLLSPLATLLKNKHGASGNGNVDNLGRPTLPCQFFT